MLLKNKNNFWKQLGEATFLGFLTLTNLNDTGTAKLCRIIVFYYNLSFCTSIVIVIVIICNINPENVGSVHWENLALVKDITTLHIVCAVDIACFLISWILDIVCQKLSDYGGVYHSARRDVVVIVEHRFCCLLDKIANEDEC